MKQLSTQDVDLCVKSLKHRVNSLCQYKHISVNLPVSPVTFQFITSSWCCCSETGNAIIPWTGNPRIYLSPVIVWQRAQVLYARQMERSLKLSLEQHNDCHISKRTAGFSLIQQFSLNVEHPQYSITKYMYSADEHVNLKNTFIPLPCNKTNLRNQTMTWFTSLLPSAG